MFKMLKNRLLKDTNYNEVSWGVLMYRATLEYAQNKRALEYMFLKRLTIIL